MKFSITILLVLSCSLIFAQVELNNNIIMESTANNGRQVLNTASPSDSTNLVPAKDIVVEKMNFVITSLTDTLYVNVFPPITSYSPGMMLKIKMENGNSGNVIINIDSVGYVPLFKYVTELIDSAEIDTGQIISLIYDGADFQLISPLSRPCLSGMVEVNDQYCIEANKAGIKYFWNAVTRCYNKGARLCSWAEWFYACQKPGLTVNNMTTNWEWISTIANSNGQIKLMGGGSCTAGLVGRTGDQAFNSRCCYSK